MLSLLHQAYKISIKALLVNKARSFLTMLGIIIGVGAVIVIMSIGAGAQSLILSQVESLGSNKIGILPGKSEDDGPPASVMGVVITTLNYDDLQAIRSQKNVPNLINAVGYSKGMGSVAWQSESYETNISGCTESYLDVEGGEVDLGRFFSVEEEKNLARVVVLGSTVRDEVFGETNPVGKKVKIKNKMFEVIGVMKKRGTVAFQDYDDQVFIPIMTMQKVIEGVNHLSMIRATVDVEENTDRAIEDIKVTLRERHGIEDSSGNSDDFTVRSAAAAVDAISTITDALKYFLAAMAAISLLVGGIGIMNIMLISVTERTREIGLRKAIGAKYVNIIAQFLLEAVTLTLIGGIIGLIGGIIVSYLVYLVIIYLGYDWKFIISLGSILLSLSVSIFIGIVFGIYPARRAARLQPVEALRYE